MNLLKPLFTRQPEPEVRRVLDMDTGLPIPLVRTPVDWKWRALNALSALVKYSSLLAYVSGHIPGKWAAIIFGVASATKEVAFIVADYLDNGTKDNSFKPET